MRRSIARGASREYVHAARPNGVDAVQIEIGADRSNNLVKVARDIADAAARTLKPYYLRDAAKP